MNVLSTDQQLRVLAALVEGNSIRSTERLVGVHRDTIMRFGMRIGQACDRLHRNRVRGLYSHLLELDEIWSFVGKKQGRLEPDQDDTDVGDQYTFVGFDATNKLAVSYLTGKRTGENTNTFAADLRARVIGAPQITTDGFSAYIDAIELAFGSRVHHGVAIKIYENPGDGGAEHRYAPGTVTGIERRRISGTPDEDTMNTTYVERQNLTMRMSIRRFTRLTNAFSRKVENLRAAVALHFGNYNWVRVHGTLRVTPAMAVGLTDHVWSLAELLEVAQAEPELANDPGPPAPQARVAAGVAGEKATGRPSWLRVIDGGRRDG